MSDATTPSCPLCGSAKDVGEVNEPTGRWYCSACPMAFHGGGQEYLDMGEKRAIRQARNEKLVILRFPTTTSEGR